MIQLGFDASTIALLLGGALGAGLRVLSSSEQKTWCRQSIVDVVIGGLFGALFPMVAAQLGMEWTPGATPAWKGILVAVMMFLTQDSIRALLLDRFAPAPPARMDRRIEDPKRPTR